MQKLLRVCAVSGLLAGLAFAENYSGRLLDATCVDQNKSKNCDPTSMSVAFVIVADGKTMHLDDAGNAKAVKAMRGRADRQKDPNTPGSSAVNAKVTGTAEGDVLRVDVIEVQ
jgi:hypothetical protein